MSNRSWADLAEQAQELLIRALGKLTEAEQRADRAESAILAYARWVRATFPPDVESSDAEQRLLDHADGLEAQGGERAG